LAHDVVKRVGERSYRYRVERYRDPSTGKMRGRWTYLGRVATDGSATAARRRTADTRERLLAALGRLVERRPFGEVTAGQVAEEAGLAHGTFYRYFRDKHDALRAAVEHVRDAVDWSVLLADRPVGTRLAERRRIRRWAEGALRAPIERPGLVRAWLSALEADTELARLRNERRAQTAADLVRYLERLDALGKARVPHARGTAAALRALMEATARTAVAGQTVDDEEIEGALAVIDRAIFGG